ncbi:MAG: dTDP-6-deoxy-L-hexose 3-O-methyltransferase [Selenomonas ruminantium]|nr:dTDP-6-deoxy-L-hexose 3-O-methyltransferase [Selenomonas ruminantium]
MKFLREKAFDYENGFMLTSEVYRLGNIMAHYELYKKIVNLPGALVELGVFKGNSILQFATFRELLENERSRQIIGFDAFGMFPQGGQVSTDEEFVEKWNKQFEGEFLTKDELRGYMDDKGLKNVELIKGNIMDTLPEYLQQHPYLRISFLHIDTDVYEPAKFGLELLWDRVVKHGVVVFDDYGTVEGETVAIDEFLLNHSKYHLEKFPFSHTKPSFLIKDDD